MNRTAPSESVSVVRFAVTLHTRHAVNKTDGGAVNQKDVPWRGLRRETVRKKNSPHPYDLYKLSRTIGDPAAPPSDLFIVF